MNYPLHKEVKPLSKAEAAWIKRLEKTLLACPTARLELVTIGDAALTVIDGKVMQRHNLEIHDGNADRNGLVLAEVRSRPSIHGVSG